MSTITLEHISGKEVLGTLQKQAWSPSARYTVIVKEEHISAPPNEFVPEFYDDEADSEAEIESLLAARTTSNNNNL